MESEIGVTLDITAALGERLSDVLCGGEQRPWPADVSFSNVRRKRVNVLREVARQQALLRRQREYGVIGYRTVWHRLRRLMC